MAHRRAAAGVWPGRSGASTGPRACLCAAVLAGHAGQNDRRPCLLAGGWRRYCRAMRFGILGPLTVADGERPIAVPGAKPSALLVLLVLHAGVVPSDRRGA
jgi:hypothetical protein